jgi:hypothetical protein
VKLGANGPDLQLFFILVPTGRAGSTLSMNGKPENAIPPLSTDIIYMKSGQISLA